MLRLAGSSVIGQHLAPELATGFLKHLVAPDDLDSVMVDVERDPDDPALVEVKLLDQPDAPIQGIEIVPHGSEIGSKALNDEEADVLMLVQQMAHSGISAFSDAFSVDMHSPAAEHIIGIDNLEFIVNPENQLAVINREVIGEILTNGINDWGKEPLHRSELDGPISVIGSEDDKTENSLINEALLYGRPQMQDKSVFTAAEMTELVRKNKLAFGHVSKDFRGKNRAISINECGVIYEPDGPSIHVEDFEVNTKDHPFARPAYLHANPGIANSIRDQFLEYVVSLESGMGQEIVSNDFVDLGLHLSSEDATDWRYYMVGDQLAEIVENRDTYRTAIREARRLSAKFLFRNYSFGMVLDSRTQRDLKHLAEYIRNENIDPESVMLFGFADSVGSAEINAALSEERAVAVADQLRAGGINISACNIQGIGEDAPITCNNLPDGQADIRGRYKNRRVEVWLRG